METTFGTPIALSGTAYKAIEFQKGQFFDLGINKSNLQLNRSSRLLSLVDLFHDNFSGPVGYTFETYCSKDRIADFLYMVTQLKVSEGAVGTGYSKVFRMHASQPDFTANAGAFCTMIWDSPESGKDARFTSGILRDLTLTMDKSGTGESNLVKMSGTFIFKKYEVDQTYSGTAAARNIALAYKAHEFAMDLTFNAVGINDGQWERFSLTLANNAIGLDKDANGYPVTYFLNPADSLKASLEVWYTGVYTNALTDFAAGNTVALTMTKGTVDTDGYFLISLNGKITNNPFSSGNSQLRVPIELQLGNTTAALTDGCTLTVADAIDQTP
jgi:hypothetical protein